MDRRGVRHWLEEFSPQPPLQSFLRPVPLPLAAMEEPAIPMRLPGAVAALMHTWVIAINVG